MVAAALLACAGPPPDYEQPWIEITTPHFRLLSDASEKQALKLAHELEDVRTAILTWTGASPPPAVRLSVFVFRDFDSFRPFEMQMGSDGYFVPRPDGGSIVMNAEGQAYQIARHELVHFLLLGDRERHHPPWYNEGLAEVLSTASRQGDVIRLGDPPRRSLSALRSYGEVPVAELLMERNLSGWYGVDQASFYASAWALVHYLRLGYGSSQPDGNPRLDRYLKRVSAGSRQLKSFELVFGMTTEEMDDLVRSYLWRGSLPTVEVGMKTGSDAIFQLRSLSVDEVAYELGVLFDLIHGGSGDGAERLFDAALDRNPQHARAMASRAILRAGADDDEELSSQLRRASALAPGDPLVHLLVGRHLFRVYAGRVKAEAGAQPAEQSQLLADARQQFARSIELDPMGAEAYYWLGLSYLFEGRDLSAAKRSLERAYELAPWSSEIALRLSEAYLAQGNKRRARRMLKAVRSWAHHPEDAARAEALLNVAGQRRWGSAAPE